VELAAENAIIRGLHFVWSVVLASNCGNINAIQLNVQDLVIKSTMILICLSSFAKIAIIHARPVMDPKKTNVLAVV